MKEGDKPASEGFFADEQSVPQEIVEQVQAGGLQGNGEFQLISGWQ